MRSAHVQVNVDLGRIRSNCAAIRQTTGVDVIAVVKADAYGLGAMEVAKSIADLVSEFCVFSLEEARAAKLWENTGKTSISLGPAMGASVEEFIAAHVRPAVWSAEEAGRLREANPVLSVDTGMKRFACPAEQIDEVIAAGAIREAMTHAIRMEHVDLLVSLVGNRNMRLHAAASALLKNPAARLNAVRPGVALYRGATRVSTRIVEVRAPNGPAGYTGFLAPRFGVILCGYSNGLRRGRCRVNGVTQTVIEVGMQSAFVEIRPHDRVGDEVVLLGEGLSEADVAAAWGTSEQLALFALAGTVQRGYVGA
jgi:alanine racemase